MKLNKLIALSAAACIAVTAQANTDKDKELKLAAKQASSLKFTQTDFGSYKVEKSLRLVPASVVADQHVVMRKGDMAVVNATQSSDLVTKGTLVRNILTDNLTSLSGNITVLLKDGMSADDIAVAMGMKVVSVFPGTAVAVLAVSANQDILITAKELKSQGYAKEAKIEVLETIYTAQ
ncbi:hypothetical protein [Pseudoalteromonas mariniglutinosa]|uniref:hypothetical protein n=1 Tax=Pseudoalteromonas mariniglutinosa TaxID=206042 RepID=UPI0038506779